MKCLFIFSEIPSIEDHPIDELCKALLQSLFLDCLLTWEVKSKTNYVRETFYFNSNQPTLLSQDWISLQNLNTSDLLLIISKIFTTSVSTTYESDDVYLRCKIQKRLQSVSFQNYIQHCQAKISDQPLAQYSEILNKYCSTNLHVNDIPQEFVEALLNCEIGFRLRDSDRGEMEAVLKIQNDQHMYDSKKIERILPYCDKKSKSVQRFSKEIELRVSTQEERSGIKRKSISKVIEDKAKGI